MVNGMILALKEAQKGYGTVSPNPLVGAVVLKNRKVIGRGHHEYCGGPHAEVNAVNSAGAENCEGATLYVTLEPCSTFGRTPPCTELIIKSKFKKVVAGTLDPNPKHAGKGIEILKAAGIEVEVGMEEEKCRKINAAFFKYITTGMPLVTLKMAMTLDGKIACHNGVSKWITGSKARERVQYLRRGSDALLIGANTALTDKPVLFARNPNGSFFERRLERFVASKKLNPADLSGIFCEPLPEIVDLSSAEKWEEFLGGLGKKGKTSLLIEGGGELAASALAAGAVDVIEFHIAMKILGGNSGKAVIGGASPDDLSNTWNLKKVETFFAGDDLIVRGEL